MEDSNNAPQTPEENNSEASGQKPNQKMVMAVLGVLLIAIVGVIAFVLTSSDSNEDSTSNSDSAEVESDVILISIDEDGFTPNTLSVDAGSVVRWTNDGSEPHWIASNPHPEHDLLPGLDSLEPIEPGGSYEFTFETAGTFGYHDHLNPLVNGEVVVE